MKRTWSGLGVGAAVACFLVGSATGALLWSALGGGRDPSGVRMALAGATRGDVRNGGVRPEGGSIGVGGVELVDAGSQEAGVAGGRGGARTDGVRRALGIGTGEREGEGAGGDVERLLAVLAGLPRETGFVLWAHQTPEGLRSKVVDLLLTAGGLETARELVGEPPKFEIAQRVARAFEGAERMSEAAEMWRRLLEETRTDAEQSLREGKGFGASRGRSNQVQGVLAGLGRTDPEALVELLADWRTLAQGETIAYLDRMRAEHMFKLGRKEEASALALDLIADEDQYEGALELLLSNDPERGEAVLREELERTPSDAFAHGRLLMLLREQGREEEFKAMFDDALRSGRAGVVQVLMEMSDALPLERMAELAADPRYALHLAPQLVQRYANEERWSEAAQGYDALVQMLERGELLDYVPSPPHGLLQQDPSRVWSWAQRMEMAGSNNDEVWGDIGDVWMSLGEVERARRAWQRALEIDPQDGEWIGNLRRLRRQGR